MAVPIHTPSQIANLSLTNGDKAIQALRILNELPGDDLARPDYHAAAQTFALLEIADAIRSAGGRPT